MGNIRPMRQEDLQNVEYVCRMTAGPKSRQDPAIGNKIAKIYSTYYARECRDTSFVLADENDKAVGYILCEPDCKRYKRIYRKTDVPQIFKLNKKDGIFCWFFPVPYLFFGGKYPAHLHIDILPEYQSKGYGGEMIETLLAHLKNRDVKGVMLITNKDNKGAIRFYERHGFKPIFTHFGVYAMAKDLK